jgi:hydrogenase nickel incorporation protein HypA/HybF
MHELSICGSIAGIAVRHADGRQVDAIHVRVGQLRQIVPETLIYCWSMVTSTTELEGSRLDVDYVRARIRCRTCGNSDDLGDYPIMLCGACDGADIDVLAGEEFVVTSLDLARA